MKIVTKEHIVFTRQGLPVPLQLTVIDVRSIADLDVSPRNTRKAGPILQLLHTPVVERLSESTFMLLTERETVRQTLQSQNATSIAAHVLDTRHMSEHEAKVMRIRLLLLDASYVPQTVAESMKEIKRDEETREILRQDLMPDRKRFCYTLLSKNHVFGTAAKVSAATLYRRMKKKGPKQRARRHRARPERPVRRGRTRPPAQIGFDLTPSDRGPHD